MAMFAIIKTGDRQYRVAKDDVIVVEKLAGKAGDKVKFGEVLMVADGDKVTLGAPFIADAAVAGELVDTWKGEKVPVFKKKRRSTYRRKRGHRQLESHVRITGLPGGEKRWDPRS